RSKHTDRRRIRSPERSRSNKGTRTRDRPRPNTLDIRRIADTHTARRKSSEALHSAATNTVAQSIAAQPSAERYTRAKSFEHDPRRPRAHVPAPRPEPPPKPLPSRR